MGLEPRLCSLRRTDPVPGDSGPWSLGSATVRHQITQFRESGRPFEWWTARGGEVSVILLSLWVIVRLVQGVPAGAQGVHARRDALHRRGKPVLGRLVTELLPAASRLQLLFCQCQRPLRLHPRCGQPGVQFDAQPGNLHVRRRQLCRRRHGLVPLLGSRQGQGSGGRP